ncbi:hypothetical protein ABZ477_00925 [Microbacterium sp. NPDC019599]|uniref:hypothetical protein n=1 Tax=Microbacterium sp. NPDC019599 TaxID=3154690 RepID=UPI003405AE15
MGLFTQKPEENDEWAGLPSEPLRARTDAEQLKDAAPVDAGGVDLLFGVGSISVLPIPSSEAPGADAAADEEPTAEESQPE